MTNLTISKQEISFLKDSLLTKYSKNINYPLDGIIKELTGSIKHYERISEYIQEYVGMEDNVVRYTSFLSESPFKITIRRWLNEREDLKKATLRELKNSVSANVLRKLIFFGGSENEQSYKENFIIACYLFIGIDRTEKLAVFSEPVVNGDKTTVPPNYFVKGGTDSKHKKAKFFLKPLKENDEVIDTRKKILEFEGEHITLSRSNIDPQNNTITSKIQAELKLINGDWYIDNQSQLKTTFIQVLRPTKINKGDVIILGNSRFLFDE